MSSVRVKSLDFAFVFSRFVHFYHMTDEHVLAMPVRRFWCMEAQISRIQSEIDLRHVYASSATVSGKNAKEVVERLTLTLGETSQIDRPLIVEPEPEAANKFAALAMKLNQQA